MPQKELETVERYMRDQGFRWTAQRRLIAEVAFENHDHFTAEELLDMCRKVDSQVSRATVYRTLGMLEEAGFVEGLDTGEGGRRYEHVLGHAHHDHMLCQRCKKIIEFHDEALEALKVKVAADRGYTLVSHTLKLVVECQDSECEGRTEAQSSDQGGRGAAGS